ncbi:MAG: hypothetical protein LAT68_14400 [Cyclobacteriaceae bacterium]|nr:hypothetical protein [Cyclobacteriaceae bacterium]MCH8517512.1 hypothetical protein [Cyclobacteriaceae bacterium]
MSKHISELELDAITEIINIGVGKGAAMLNDITEYPIELSIPEILVSQISDLQGHFLRKFNDKRLCGVKLKFTGIFTGSADIVFDARSANGLVSAVSGQDLVEDEEDLDGIKASTLSEIGNIVLNGIMGTFGNIFTKEISFMIPSYFECDANALPEQLSQYGGDMLITCKTHFKIRKLAVSGDIFIVFADESFDFLLNFVRSSD